MTGFHLRGTHVVVMCGVGYADKGLWWWSDGETVGKDKDKDKSVLCQSLRRCHVGDSDLDTTPMTYNSVSKVSTSRFSPYGAPEHSRTTTESKKRIVKHQGAQISISSVVPKSATCGDSALLFQHTSDILWPFLAALRCCLITLLCAASHMMVLLSWSALMVVVPSPLLAMINARCSFRRVHSPGMFCI